MARRSQRLRRKLAIDRQEAKLEAELNSSKIIENSVKIEELKQKEIVEEKETIIHEAPFKLKEEKVVEEIDKKPKAKPKRRRKRTTKKTAK